MKKLKKTIKEINERITEGSVKVVTAAKVPDLVDEIGINVATREVDVVTTGTFGAMCSSGAWLNFGHSDPPIRMESTFLNDVEAYSGVAAVDTFIGATQKSISQGIKYGGAHVIEDLIKGHYVTLKANSTGTDCYPRTSIETDLCLDDINQAVMCNPRNGYQRYNAAINTSKKDLYTYMGKLKAHIGNITYSGAGELSPIMNDPNFQTTGIGTRIFLGGTQGYIIGNGTQHSPNNGFSTLMVEGNLKEMTSDYIRAATFSNYGCSLYIGLGIPIPILSSEILEKTAIRDKDIKTSIIDYSIQSRTRPIIKKVTYEELKSGSININGKDIPTSPLSSYFKAQNIANELKKQITKGEFTLTEAVNSLSTSCKVKFLNINRQKQVHITNKSSLRGIRVNYVAIDKQKCIDCGLCLSYCDNGVFCKDSNWKIDIVPEKCIHCNKCKDICPQQAIILNDEVKT